MFLTHRDCWRSLSVGWDGRVQLPSAALFAPYAAACVVLLLMCASVAHAQLGQIGQMSPEDATRMLAVEAEWQQELPDAIRQAKGVAALRITPQIALVSWASPHVALQLTNPTDSALTVDLALRLTYPQTDTTGTLIPDSLATTTTAVAQDLTHWVQPVPAHLTLAAHATQTLALTLTFPATLPDGEYETTVIAIARHVVLPFRQFLRDTLIHLPSGGDVANSMKPVVTDLVTTVPILYRQGVLTTRLSLSHAPRAVLQGDSLLRVCVPLQLSGTAHAEARLRIAITAGGRAVQRAVPDTTLPLAVYTNLTPCVAFDVRTLPPGSHTVAVDITSDRPELPPAVRLPFSPLQTRVPFTIASSVRTAAERARAADTIEDQSDSVFSDVTLAAGPDPLLTQLAAEVTKAAALGRTPILDVGAPWCGPCHTLMHIMRLAGLRATMRGMYVIHVDAGDWGGALQEAGVRTMALPVLAALARDGRPTSVQIVGVSLGSSKDKQQPGANIDLLEMRAARPDLEKFFQAARAQFTSAGAP